jgi:predicted nucleic acid-binding protein
VSEFVIDASALVELFVGAAPDAELRHRALTGVNSAPELIDVESAQSIRKLVLAGHISNKHGTAAINQVRDAPLTRVTHRALLNRVWELRHAITAYDATYIALAERLRVPLLTCDARLGGSNGHEADVVVYPRS